MPSFDWIKSQVIAKSKEVSDLIQRESVILQDKIKSAVTANASRSTSSDSAEPVTADEILEVLNAGSADLVQCALSGVSRNTTMKAVRMTNWWIRSISGRQEWDFVEILVQSNGIENLVIAVCASDELRRAVSAPEQAPENSFVEDESMTIVDSVDRDFAKHWRTICSLVFGDQERELLEKIVFGTEPEVVREDADIRSVIYSLAHCLKADSETIALQQEAKALRHVIDALTDDSLDSGIMRINNLIRLDDVFRQLAEQSSRRDSMRAEALEAIRAVLETAAEKSKSKLTDFEARETEAEAKVSDLVAEMEIERNALLTEIDAINKELTDSGIEKEVSDLESQIAAIDAELIKIGQQKLDLSMAISETSKAHAADVKYIKSEIERLDEIIVTNAGTIHYLKQVNDFIEPLAAKRLEKKPKDWGPKLKKLKEQHFNSVRNHLEITEEYVDWLVKKFENLKLLPVEEVAEMRRLENRAAMVMLQIETMMAQLHQEPTVEMNESIQRIKTRISEIRGATSSAPVIDVNDA